MPDNSHIRVHISIDTVLHAWLFASVEFARRDFGGDALLEAHVSQAVDCRLELSFLAWNIWSVQGGYG